MHDIYLETTANKPYKENQDLTGKIKVSKITHINYDNEILTYYEGAEFPMKGYPTQGAIIAVNIAKAIFIQVFKIRLSLVSILQVFNYIGNRVLEQYFLKDKHRTANTLELDSIVFSFVFSLTSNRLVASQFSRIFSHLIEYDNAYRLRFVDLASETSKKALIENPRKELKRLLNVLAKREIVFGHQVTDKFKYVYKVLAISLLIPKVRAAFVNAIALSDWSKMQYDDTDRYWACLRTDYDFMGMSIEERLQLIKQCGYSLPIQHEQSVL